MITYRTVDGVTWVNEGSHLIAVAPGTGAQRLAGAEAALWRWLHQDLGWPAIRALYAALVGVSEADGETQMIQALQQWVEVSLLEVSRG
ncbi:MAG: hypothetical protein GYA17_07240 [Chloroflexi bacterium]|nr:hypothetical protein [Anaerolineaceae bacterium]NMB88137.1 hypothetical protein [Chloroflexota bacterium]